MNASIDVPKIAMAVALQMMLCMVSNFTGVGVYNSNSCRR